MKVDYSITNGEKKNFFPVIVKTGFQEYKTKQII